MSFLITKLLLPFGVEKLLVWVFRIAAGWLSKKNDKYEYASPKFQWIVRIINLIGNTIARMWVTESKTKVDDKILDGVLSLTETISEKFQFKLINIDKLKSNLLMD